MLRIAQFGAGRIGAIHADNVARRPDVELAYVVDVNADAAAALAARHGAQVSDVATALADKSVGAVIIASSTDTHADLIEAAARAGKAVFCEKPVDLSIARCDQCLATVKETGVAVAMGFNRRYDPTFRSLRDRLVAGEIGKLEILSITSRDPAPPPVSYIKVSGGLFRDMMIHDFDMARWLLGEEPVEIYAAAAVNVDPAIGEAGDVDTATVSMKTASGKLAIINNSRRATYGYDQRVEAFGAKGMLQAGNHTATQVVLSGANGVSADKPLDFFLQRYVAAYQAELDDFVNMVIEGREPLATVADGRAALLLADAALSSLREGRAVRL